MALPGVQEAVEAGDWARARRQLDLLAERVREVTAAVKRAAREVETN
jgi:hypothetical protein